ncbi:MAG: FG-GAP repeat domain-containing protein, partial [Acidobacteriota bacterium]
GNNMRSSLTFLKTSTFRSALVILLTCSSSAALAQSGSDPAVNFPGGDGMRAMVSVDLDGDGSLDLATADKSGGTATVFLNNGDGTADLAVLNNSPEVNVTGFFVQRRYTVSVLLNDRSRSGSFQPETRFEVGPNPFQVLSADLNGDGFPDLVTANHFVSNLTPAHWVSLLVNNGDGSFQPEIKVESIPSFNSSAAAADIDADGFTDLVLAATYTPGHVEILMNNGNLTFTGTKLSPRGHERTFFCHQRRL